MSAKQATSTPPRPKVTPGGASDPAVAGLGPTGGDTLAATIERIVPGGAGMAHAGGLTLFVPMTAPGDTVELRVERRRGQTAWGTLLHVAEPGPDRTEPPCPYYGVCGGCDLQHLTYEAQLAAKLDIVRDCLRRIGGIEPPEGLDIVPSPNLLHYRAVAEWAVDSKRNALGYRARSSHEVVDVEVCPISSPPVQSVLDRLRARKGAGLLPPGITEYRAVAGDDEAGLAPPLGDEFPAELTRTVAGETYRYDAESFFQANGLLLDEFVAEALWQAEPDPTAPEAPLAGDGPGFAVDLYCGVGLFTVPLARRYRRLVGVEGFGLAARWARRNLADAGLGHAKIEVNRVENWLQKRATALAGADLVLLDPPRTGAGPAVVEGILAMAPRKITYVSCDPATQARDLKGLLAGGYEIVRMRALDMFPQSHHVETIAHLVRSEQ